MHLAPLDPKGKGITTLRNADNLSPKDTARHTRRSEISTTSPCECRGPRESYVFCEAENGFKITLEKN